MSRKRTKKLERLKKAKKRKRRIRILILTIIIIFISYNKFFEKEPLDETTKQTASEINNEKETQISNTAAPEESEKTPENQQPENKLPEENKPDNSDVKVQEKEQESQEVKTIVEKYMQEKNLNENNFAFFYYKPSTKEYYFYNENTFFTAASTIKVPIAMAYYDKINNGEKTLESTLQYKSGHYEAGGGSTSARYKVGNYIPLQFLLEQMIVNSDNTATNILISGLGGQKPYRAAVASYTQRELPSNFSATNITSAGYASDVIKILYANQEKYQDLIGYMKKSSGGGYLKKNITTCEVAHKYGSYNGNIHDYGIVYAKEEYLIGVFTKGVPHAEDLIASINQDILAQHE